ncbi:hypothetical protein [Geomonas subterranea]|uniref:hypothetical protein n=1 Tax=Geomonas subterranea TaxID=2847989 RepID=UPI001EF05A37|nr:hypothetical protein [Geomonas subterranea]
MKRLLLLPLFLLFACLAAPTSSSATELYAQQTGKSCNACHVDPAGGGELTAAGKEFAASRAVQNEAPRVAPAAKVVRFLAGYLHMLTAILWFGTILYVHLVLKPAYAAGDSPGARSRSGFSPWWLWG